MSSLICLQASNPGRSLDPIVLRLEVDLNHLENSGAKVLRYNFEEHPDVFATYPQVLEHLEKDRECLPMILVDDKIVSQASYPSREQLAAWVGVRLVSVGGCGGGSCTCGG